MHYARNSCIRKSSESNGYAVIYTNGQNNSTEIHIEVVVVVEQPTTTTTTRAETTINNKNINTVIPTVFGRRIFIYFLKKKFMIIL